MYPVLFRIGPIEVPAYGAMLALGILLAWFYFRKQFPESVNQETLATMISYSILAGLLGSRLNYMLEHLREIDSARSFFSMLISRSGLTVYGGLIAGAFTAYFYSRKHGLPVPRVLDAGASAICIGYFFGRAGCQLAGDGDYGIPSDVPWAMAYPYGTVPTLQKVHPTPVYDMISYLFIFLILRFAGRRLQPGRTFAVFLILAGAQRFAIEFIRNNPKVLLNLTEAQWVSLVLVFAGAVGMMRGHRAATEVATTNSD